jgi:hypothetical protein
LKTASLRCTSGRCPSSRNSSEFRSANDDLDGNVSWIAVFDVHVFCRISSLLLCVIYHSTVQL